MRDNLMPSRNIHNAHTRLKTLSHNPRLHIIRPMSIATTRFNNRNTTSSNTSIRHSILQ